MDITADGKFVKTIGAESLVKILSVYPDEPLYERKTFKKALSQGVLRYEDLVAECDKLLLPWQLFFLNETNLKNTLAGLETARRSKFDLKKIGNRMGPDGGISLRIVDRLIGLQQFAIEQEMGTNRACGMLKGLDSLAAARKLVEYFTLDYDKFRNISKEKALEYLIGIVEKQHMCVSRGVLKNKILPMTPDLMAIYKQSSGFVIQSDVLPYIFLPSELNTEETSGRQLYTLVLLLVLIGLNEYNTIISSDYSYNSTKGTKFTRYVHNIVSEVLLPSSETQKLYGTKITAQIRDKFSKYYNLTPTAVLVTFKCRGIIVTDEEYEELLSNIGKAIPKSPGGGAVKVSTSVEKFCSHWTNTKLIRDITSNAMSSTRAQYLIFGHINKKKYQEYKMQNGL